MISTPGTIAPRIDEQFLDLICSDDELLAAEFDAIIAAEWPTPPASRPRPGASGDKPERGRTRRSRSV